jgi:hypothetical protein
MTPRPLSALAGSLLLLWSLSVAPVQAQEWAQEVQIITTVGYNEPLHVFVDSLNDVLSRHPETPVRRTPDADVTVPFRDLRDELLDDGLDLNSASHAFIRYRFELVSGSEIVETIEDIYLIYRGREDRSDLPILHVSTQEPEVNALIRNRGIASPVNLKAVKTFRKMLAFPHLNVRQETAMVEIAGRAVREDPTDQEKVLTEFLMNRMTVGGGSYVLEMPRATVARVAASPPSGESQ